MSTARLMNIIDTVLDDAKSAVLATIDEEGLPRLRWITPTTFPDRPGMLYMITGHHFDKIGHVRGNPNGSMLLQTRSLATVLSLRGTLSVLENPAIRSETLERIAGRLNAFWKIEAPERELVVLEFTITRATLYLPQKGSRESVALDGGAR